MVITFNILWSLCGDRVAKWSIAAESIWTQKYRTLSLVADRGRLAVTRHRCHALTPGQSREQFAGPSDRVVGEAYRAQSRARGTKTETADRPSLKKHLPSAETSHGPRLCARRRSNKESLSDKYATTASSARPAVTAATQTGRRARAKATELDMAELAECP